MMCKNHLWEMAVCPCILLAAKSALAADTVETWDKGAADFEIYAGAEGLGKRSDDVTAFSDGVVGFGLEERFSGYFGATLEAEGDLEPSGAALYMGVFGTPVETDHFDVDLFLDFAGLDGFSVSPGIELNWDHDPQMRTFGLYSRASFPFYAGESSSSDEGDAPSQSAARFDVVTTLGGYVILAERHQLLLEVGLDFTDFPSKGAGLGANAAALGYNVVVSDYLEIIAEVSTGFDGKDSETGRVPRCWTEQRRPCGVGASIGFIATLPR